MTHIYEIEPVLRIGDYEVSYYHANAVKRPRENMLLQISTMREYSAIRGLYLKYHM